MDSEVLTKAEQVEEEFLRLYDEFHVFDAPERKKADIIDSFWDDIYKKVFKPKPGDKTYNNVKTTLKTYDVEEVEEVCKKYITLCQRYGGVIKITEFANLVGIHRATFNVWHNANKTNGYICRLNSNDVDKENEGTIYILNDNSVDVIYNGNSKYMSDGNTKELSSMRYDVIKKLKESRGGQNTNGLSLDTMGNTVLANNDEEVNKMYAEKQRQNMLEMFHDLSNTQLALPVKGADGELHFIG